MVDENGVPFLYIKNGTQKVCKLYVVDDRSFLLFPRQKSRGEGKVENEPEPFSLEKFVYEASLCKEQLLAMSRYRW